MTSKNRQIEAIYPLSPMQQGMLFHTLNSPDSGIYFEQWGGTFVGRLDISAFKQAWQSVVERHPVLRTLFAWQTKKEPLQVVIQNVELPWTECDWRAYSTTEQQARLESFLQADMQQGFALNQAPLMRFSLIQLADDTYHFVWSHHHLLLDGWSLSTVLTEVLVFYEAFSQSQEISLAQPRPYKDYIVWLGNQDMAEAETFWRHNLRGFRLPTPLLVDKPTKEWEGRESIHKTKKKQVSSTITANLQTFAQKHHLTVSTLIQGAWAILLNRYSGEDEVMFGATVSGRPPTLPGVESMAGVFINTLPVRVGVSTQDSSLSWLKQIQTQQVERDQFAFSPLVDIQGWSDIRRGLPLFDSLVVVENYPLDSSLQEQGNKTVEIRNIHSTARANYPLVVVATPGHTLTLSIIYDSNRFGEATITRMLDHLETLLVGILTHPNQQVAQQPLLTEAEQHQLLVDWNDTRTDYPVTQCLHQLFEAQVERTPEATAVDFEDACLTYQELNEQANQLAHYLRKLGIGPDVPVAIYLDRSAQMIVAHLAILKAGGYYVPLDLTYPQERLAFMLADTQAPVLLTQKAVVSRLPAHKAQLVCLDECESAITAESKENPVNQTSALHLCYVMYTSGSTGRPKGVAIPHRGVVRLVKNTNFITFYPDDVVAQASTASFDAATYEIWGALLSGAALVGISKETLLSPQEFVNTLQKKQINVLFLTTSLFNQLAQQVPTAFNAIRHLSFGGEAADPRRVKEVLEHSVPQQLVNLYGPTESTTATTTCTVKEVSDDMVALPIGRVIANTQVYILDQELRPTPIGVPGELYIGGDGLAQGYLNCPELTAEKFVPNPFSNVSGQRLYKTGDLVRYLPDGNIEFLGRIDNQVKIRGFRIEPGEIEAVLAQSPDIKGAAVVVSEDPLGNKCLIAYVIPDQDEPSVDKLRSFLKEKLPHYMIPAAFVMLKAFPLNPNGKLDHKALPEPDLLSQNGSATLVAPRNPFELQLTQIWAEVLNTPLVGVQDNFFDLGGHSLLAVHLMARIQQHFGKKLPLASLFEGPTVEQLAHILQQQAEESVLPLLVPIKPDGSKQPFFCVSGAGGNIVYFYHLARYLDSDRPFYAFQAKGLDGKSEPHTCVEEMAADYIAALQAVQPEGPYLLGGHSFGSWVAFEMGQQLQEQGHEVALLAVLDTPGPGSYNLENIQFDEMERMVRVSELIERWGRC
jgi:surfactin family lipopeptide synthetase C